MDCWLGDHSQKTMLSYAPAAAGFESTAGAVPPPVYQAAVCDVQGSPAEAAGYSPSDETLQGFWNHCQDILSRAAVEVPEPSLDANSQEELKAHAKLEQVCKPVPADLLVSFD